MAGDARRCLVVDDDASMRLLAQLQLEAVGAEVVVAADGHEAAVLLAGSEAFAMVVADRRIPSGPTGEETLEAARDRNPSTVLVLLTAHVDPDTVAEAARLGATVVDKLNMHELPQLWASAQFSDGDGQ